MKFTVTEVVIKILILMAMVYFSAICPLNVNIFKHKFL